MKQYDAIIIGFGKGGKTLAAELAKRKLDVAVVERSEKMYGGTCINIGCIPTKTLVHAAKHADKDASWEVKKAYYRQSIARKEEVVSFLRQKNYHNLADNPHITVYTGIGSFAGPDVVEVGMAEGTLQLQAPRIFINTGAETVIPPIEGIQGNPRVYTSTSIMELTELPAQLVIVGGGYIGLEFASMYARFGSKVTILQNGSVFLPKEDRDMAEAVENVLKSYGVSVITGAGLKEIKEGTAVYTKNGEEDTLDGDAILLATGRGPNTEGLHAERAGVELTKRGAVVTDKHLRTTAENIWAAGDVCGNLQFTYISLDDSRIILSDMQGDGSRTTENRGAFAYSVFMEPSFSRAGLSEKEAADKGLNYRVVRMNTDMIPKAKVLRKTTGMLKAVIDKDSGKIFGAALFCPESYEIINMVKLAMDHDLDYTVLRDFIYTHPTMSEGLNDLFAL